MTEQRKLAAVMFTDIEGYTALMSKDEQRRCSKKTGTCRSPWSINTMTNFSRRWATTHCSVSRVHWMEKEHYQSWSPTKKDIRGLRERNSRIDLKDEIINKPTIRMHIRSDYNFLIIHESSLRLRRIKRYT